MNAIAAANVRFQKTHSTDPTGWATLAAEINLAEDDHDAWSACRETAARSKKERWTIVVPAL